MASVTNVYARAFADVVLGNRLDAQKVLQEARLLSAMVADNRELRQVWEAPSISAEQKRGVLDAIVAQYGISKPVRNFVAVLIDHRRVHFLTSVVEQFEKELNARLGFAEADITIAHDLAEDERRNLEQQVEKVTGKRVLARYSKDPSILGGAIVRVGSTIYDGSVQGQLERIKEAMTS
jgi:F-type H+-transporting ATPase subunit delta